MSINDLSVNAVLHDADLFPIWDSEASRTRSVTYAALKESMKFVSDLTVTGSTLTVYYSDGTTKDLAI